MNRSLPVAWSVGVGGMDLATGCLLVLAPARTLQLMRVPVPDGAALPFLSWIGVFVGAVGASYFLGLRRGGGIPLASVWRLTSWFRSAVAVFVTAFILAGRLDPAWWTVAAVDAVVAIGQWTGLARGWLETKR